MASTWALSNPPNMRIVVSNTDTCASELRWLGDGLLDGYTEGAVGHKQTVALLLKETLCVTK